MVTTYELTYIVRPDMEDAGQKDLVSRFDGILKDNGATIIDSKDWEKRKFAYLIGKYTEGIYHIINFTAEDDKATNEFDRLAKISQDILRHMIVVREPESEKPATATKKSSSKSKTDTEKSASQDKAAE